MSDDELRALADALEPMARAPRFEDFDVPAFCAWVRACADEKPVGEVTNLGGILSTPLPVGTKLYAHPAPAVPQAEPDDDDALVLGEPDMLTPEDVRRLVPQAEPKREPLSDEQITDLWSWASKQDQGPETTQQHAFARAIERAHGIGGSDAE